MFREKSSCRFLLSPSMIHYHQIYQESKISKNYHRVTKRDHYYHEQSIRKRFHRHEYGRRIKHFSTRQKSSIRNLWEIHRSSKGQIYYYNVLTDRSQWEKPPKHQLSLSISKQSINSKKRISNDNNNDLFVKNNRYHTKKPKRSLSNVSFISDNDLDSSHSRSSDVRHRFRNNTNQVHGTTRTNYHEHYRKQQKDHIKTSEKNKRKLDEIVLSTPTSPPAYEKIHIDLVDPIPTPSTSFINNSTDSIDSYQHSHYSVPAISANEYSSQKIHPTSVITTKVNVHLSVQSCLYSNESTINSLLQLKHLSPISSFMKNSNNDHITRYYRADLIEHLLNWPSTQIERETIRLSNEEIRFTTCQLISLRTQLLSLRLKFERNRFQLVTYDYTLKNQKDFLDKLQMIDSDQL